jgi:periplasmic mercuric ion binding protein
MKNLIIIVSLLALAITAQAQKKTEEISIKTSAVCNMCKINIEKALAYEKGPKKSELTVKTQIVTVVYDTKKTSPEKIKKAISEAGYDADEVPAYPKAYEKLNACCKKENAVH